MKKRFIKSVLKEGSGLSGCQERGSPHSMLSRSPPYLESGAFAGSYVRGAASTCIYRSSTALLSKCKTLKIHMWLCLFSLSECFPFPLADMNRCVSETDEGRLI